MIEPKVRTEGAPVAVPVTYQHALRLVRIGQPAVTAEAVHARASMAARMAPEIEVVDLDTRTSLDQVRALVTVDERPWALLSLPGATRCGASLVRRLAADGLAPTRVLVRLEAPGDAMRSELEDVVASGNALACPVALLLTPTDGTASEGLGGWAGLAAETPVVRVLGVADSLEEIAIVVKEELHVWPS